MNYLKLKKFNNLNEIFELWNLEFGYIYPISKELFERNLSNVDKDASYVVINEEKLIGFILIKYWKDSFVINDYLDASWISLIYVDPKFRKKGLGSRLLELCEKEARDKNKKILYLGKDYLNYFPGLPVDMKSSCDWFLKKGFVRPYDTYDLIKSFNGNEQKLRIKNTSIIFRQSTIDDQEQLKLFMKKNWPTRWYKELIDYYDNGGNGQEYLIALDNNQIRAFAKIGLPSTSISLISYNMTWKNRFRALGGIGPLGVDISYRHRNLGYDIVAFAHNFLIDNNVSDIIIDWTGLLDFYRLMGFEVFKSYFYMNKTL